jgi:hypothetical protein
MSHPPFETVTLGESDRRAILRRDGSACQVCGEPSGEVEMKVCLRVPRTEGGTEDPSNLTTVCRRCIDPEYRLLRPVLDSDIENPSRVAVVVLEALRRGICFHPDLSEELWRIELLFRQEAKETEGMSAGDRLARAGGLALDFPCSDRAAKARFDFVRNLSAEEMAEVTKN